jgi:hypothetical protein
MTFAMELRAQRWDDHRFYHQSRVNQSLHLFSATCFLITYALIFVEPLAAAVFGWVVAMWIRQIGHFFFEPKTFDRVNDMSFQQKESIKVGFNLQRKLILLGVWAALPVLVWSDPTFFNLMPPAAGQGEVYDRIGWAWIALAFAGLLARTLWLMATRNVQTGAVWFTKIVTDPIQDIRTYWRSPYYLLRGQWIDPMDHVSAH